MKTISNPFNMKLAHAISIFLRNHPMKGAYRLTRFISNFLLTDSQKIKTPLVVKTPYGFNFWIEHLLESGVEKDIYYYGTYEAGTLNIIKICLKEGDCFFDIGSNVGLMTIFAATHVADDGSVHAFEPEPRALSILRKNIELNQLQNIKVNDFALGATSGNSTLYLQDEISLGSASFVKEADSRDSLNVKVDTIDNYIQKNNIRNIKMMKIDVEGWEYEVLKGGERLLKSVDAPILCLEYSLESHHQNNLEDLYHFLCTINDYQIFKLAKTKEWLSRLVKINSIKDLPKHDNIFCFLPNHLSDLPPKIFQSI